MKNLILNKKAISELPFIISTIFVLGFTLIFLIIPFFQHNQIINWDMAGLYFSAWYEKEYLFPDPIGWNPYFFLGFSQHQFYNPLYAYITALLAFIIPLKIAFKIIFCTTLIILPISFYYAARAYGFSKNKAGTTMIIMFAITFLFPKSFFGGNITSTFHVGLITHTLGMALFFFYTGQLEKKFGKEEIIIPTILFSAIILTHIVAAFAAAFLFIAFLICRWNKNSIKWALKHGALTTLITSFWVIPFIAKREWLAAYPIGTVETPFFFIIALGALTYILITKKIKLLPITIFISLILIFSFISTYFYPLPMHLYRFSMYLFLITPLIILFTIKKENQIILTTLIIASIFLIINTLPVYAEGDPGMYKEKNYSLPKEERVMIISSFYDETSPHLLQHYIPLEQEKHALRGLYIESSKNGRFIIDLEQEIAPIGNVAWGTYVDRELIEKNKTKIPLIFKEQLKLFNVNYVIAPNNTKIQNLELTDKVNYNAINYKGEKTSEYKYNIYKAEETNLIEVLNYTPKTYSGKDWDKEVTKWLLSENISQGVLVNEEIPAVKGTGKEKVTILERKPTDEYIKFKVESEKAVPILIKISNFPNWKAFEEGEKIKIYQASPYIMLVFGKGTIELKYENTLSDKLGNLMSIIGTLIILALILKKGIKRLNKQ